MKKMLILLCFCAIPNAVWAKGDKSNWGNLRALQSGTKIQVLDRNHPKHEGVFSSFNDQGITIHENATDQIIARADVLRVTVHGHRLRHTLIGLAIGVGGGAAIGAGGGGCSSSADCIGLTRGQTAGLGAALGGAIGAVIGALLPARVTVYRAP